MFKKIILISLIALSPVLLSVSYAVNFKGVGFNDFDQNSNDESFTQITLTAETDNEITVENGITIIIPEKAAIQWDLEKNNNIQISGNAANKIITPVVPEISKDLYYLTIPVKENFKAGDEILINGLTPRTYDERTSDFFLGVDINKDRLSDKGDFFRFYVLDAKQTDFLNPYPIRNFKAVYNKDLKRVEFNWDYPTDFDYAKTIISKKLGSADIELYSGTDNFAFDSNVFDDQKIRYEIFTLDQNGNQSEIQFIEMTIGQDLIEVPEEPKEEQSNSNPDEKPDTPEEKPDSTEEQPLASDSEKEMLKRNLNYYNIRYQIKCHAKGVNPLGSDCLWAKINLSYAQIILEKELTSPLAENELRAMAKRLRFSKARYQENCVEVDHPANYCTFFGNSLRQAQFFIDQ